MIFAATLPQVLNGSKSVTRRLVVDQWENKRFKDVPRYDEDDKIVAVVRYNYSGESPRHTTLWKVGGTYPVQPGRAKKGVARIRITGIGRDEDVRDISEEEARREGFSGPLNFLSAWNNMHDKQFLFCWDDRRLDWLTYQTHKGYDMMSQQVLYEELQKRPADRYAAWAISFELVTP